jgi:membrane fusion protein (multidrug efflux system)
MVLKNLAAKLVPRPQSNPSPHPDTFTFTMTTPVTHAPTDSGTSGKASQRKKFFALFFLILVVAAVAYAVYYYLVLNHFESTDDAYVGGDMVIVNAQVGGTVTRISASDNQTVQAGQTLLSLDSADAEVVLAEAQARLGEAVRQVQQQMGSVKEAQAALGQRQTEVKRAQGDLQRRLQLQGTEAISGEEIEHAKLAVQAALAAQELGQQQLKKALTSVSGTEVSNHPSVLRARAAYVQAYLALQRGAVMAPVSGTVAKRTVQMGQKLAAGAPLMALIPLNSVWVDANFKEPQLRSIRPGQAVTLVTDVYGPDVIYHGKVASISAGTGGAFSLLPPQNATGNWIKVVQRIPVRIALDPADLKAHPLRLGMSTEVSVDISSDGGTTIAKAEGKGATTPASSAASSDQNTAIFDPLMAKAQAQADTIVWHESHPGSAMPSPAIKP